MEDFKPCKSCDEPEACEIEGRCLEPAQEPVAWQWRRKGEPWTLAKTFNSEVFATTPDSEVRPLYAGAVTSGVGVGGGGQHVTGD
jgi:hypothetical protein